MVRLFLLAAVFIAKSVDLEHNRVRVEAMFPVEVVLEPLTAETTAKGEVLTDCKLVKVKTESLDQSPYELHCKGKRNFRVKSIGFTDPAGK
jgi:hypothetical protein